MGGSSSSSSSSNTTNVSGQNAIEGDNLGTAISGVNNSTINVTATDHGAVEKSFEMGEKALSFADNALDETLGFADGVFDDALGAVAANSEKTIMFAENALDEFSATNSENLQMVAGLAGNQAAQNSKNLNAMMELAKFNKDGGQSQLNKQQLILVGIIIVVMGVVAAKAVK
ncbi:chemotaxis protein [Vibrio hangzhouensis]|uniref:Chemotaxis protein n=1 Tax=Vibrio hangzhouensis TaxID=462991 RepID=A0A1H5YBL6_9VIBR|nr:chemotaxis protein [Vibrio hangzhouensis]SEG21378.1 hypothetical protein SAMN04488244_1093 [Vibrio hangzhouensis]